LLNKEYTTLSNGESFLYFDSDLDKKNFEEESSKDDDEGNFEEFVNGKLI
uniref:Uncharacterized protein n=1 Tax=Strongyloides papillosus TaxID=174720 RepID=A0A0N5CIQ9_STREA